MGRYVGPSCRICRREGMKLFLKGIRCSMAKCPVETGRPAPGMHGQRRGKKMSDYGTQLREKQRLRKQYGMQEEQFKRFFRSALQKRGVTGETLLQMLEMRLDSIVYKLGFAPSRKSARLMVTHGHVKVNGRNTNIPSMIVRPGMTVQVKENTRSRGMSARSKESIGSRDVPAWIVFDEKDCSGQIIRLPTREEIAPVVNEQLVVELYSK